MIKRDSIVMKKLILASLCSAFVLGACAFASNGTAPQYAGVCGGYVHVTV